MGDPLHLAAPLAPITSQEIRHPVVPGSSREVSHHGTDAVFFTGSERVKDVSWYI